MKRFIEFIRERGVAGLAIGFIFGGSVSRVTSSFVQDIVQPLIGMVFGAEDAVSGLAVGPVKFGGFITAIIDLIVLSVIIYTVFKVLKLEKLDGKK
jgi:large conductance mechanosensitive channel